MEHVRHVSLQGVLRTFCLEPMFSGDQSLSQVVGWLQVRTLLKAEV